jgi:hypothetical protein
LDSEQSSGVTIHSVSNAAACSDQEELTGREGMGVLEERLVLGKKELEEAQMMVVVVQDQILTESLTLDLQERMRSHSC